VGGARSPAPAAGVALAVRQDFVGGIVIAAFAAFVYWQAAHLPADGAGGMGPGMLPKALAVLLGALGILLCVLSVRQAGVPLGRFTFRSTLCVLGAVVAFGLAVRPLGLIAAGPMVIAIGALAISESRVIETLVVAAGVTAFCIALFKFALGLPIPLAPWLLGY
jgi:putative tricarboxylic transport membrane protein